MPDVRKREVRIDPAIWAREDMATALASRDVGIMYRILQRHGISQRRIAALTGQSQSEISEILGGRRVVAYDVLVRIAAGLGIPRGFMGLAHDVSTPGTVEPQRPTVDPATGRWVVQIPVSVDSYAAALGLCESLPSTPDADAAPRRWQLAARAVLRSRAPVRSLASAS